MSARPVAGSALQSGKNLRERLGLDRARDFNGDLAVLHAESLAGSSGAVGGCLGSFGQK